ncbi:MAG: YfhO family protein [Fuerstiella sp.]|nr:YfhO family protein [Fuerstiella sp.]
MSALASPDSSDSRFADFTVTLLEWMMAVAVGSGLSVLMWHGLLQDNDLVGGDTWTYFIPQKLVLADSLVRNELPLWHDLTGLGYPLLAESQAGVFYPSNQILYRLLDVNRAYYVSIVVHYALAFIFAWRFARCQQISHWSSLLVALVFVYGWFPARISLEWSIIGGVWLPLTLWITHEFLLRPSRWRFALLATVLSTHLLAGHFTLAFINQLCLVFYTGLRLLLCRDIDRRSFGVASAIPAAIVISLAISAVQLLPSMELKQVSQREGVRAEFSPGYGYMPPLYLTQLVASWVWWHSPEILESRQIQHLPGSIDSDTNPVEAHFYLGLVPLALVFMGFVSWRCRTIPASVQRCWLVLGVVSVVYATGWLLPVTRHLPGFSYFMGPGRYTIVATLAGAILSGLALDALTGRRRGLIPAVLLIGVFTWYDLQWASHSVADAVEVPGVLSHQEDSWIREYFQNQPPRTCRLLASGPNVANIYGVSCVPQYLGIGPAVYFSDDFDLETQPDAPDFASRAQMHKLRRLGVTHVLTTDPVTEFNASLILIDAKPDALLNRIWGRGRASCYLYELRQPGQRLESKPATALAGWSILQDTPEDVSIEVTLREAAELNLNELMYPGWTVQIDGQSAEELPGDDLTRSVRVDEGIHILRWQFDSSTVYFGAWVSCITLMSVWMSVFLPVQRLKNRKQSA